MYAYNKPIDPGVVSTGYPVPPPQNNEGKYLQKAISYFTSKMFLVQIIIAIAISVAEITVGQRYIDQCPISPNIPIFLLVHGIAKAVWAGFGIIAYLEGKRLSNSFCISALMLIDVIIQVIFILFLLAWFIAGNVWVWSVKGTYQSTNPSDSSTYCQETLHEAAQGLIVTTYIVIGIVTILTIKRCGHDKKIRGHESV